MTSAQLINQTSGEVEYYTPVEIIEAARRTMGAIDLDPASSIVANQIVNAGAIYTEGMNGLLPKWFGCVWLNHPFGRESNPRWIQKIEQEYREGNFVQACCITFACTSEKWFQPLLQRPQCFLAPRTNYRLPDGSIMHGVTKGSVVTYYGPSIKRFTESFQYLGTVKVRHA